MFRTGMVCLTIWTGFNLVLALGIVIAMSFFGQHAPGMFILLERSELAQIDPRAIATINGLAVLTNASITSLCLLSLAVIWIGLAKRRRWAFWAVAISLMFVQVFGFVSDTYFGNVNLLANLASTSILILGLCLTGYSFLKR